MESAAGAGHLDEEGLDVRDASETRPCLYFGLLQDSGPLSCRWVMVHARGSGRSMRPNIETFCAEGRKTAVVSTSRTVKHARHHQSERFRRAINWKRV
jgi:hypothetical protein